MTGSIRWILAALAAFRINWSLVYDDGPFDALFHLRRAMGAYDLDPLNAEPKTPLGRWWTCPYCTSLLSGALVVPLALIESVPTDAILALLGLSGAVMVLVRWRSWR